MYAKPKLNLFHRELLSRDIFENIFMEKSKYNYRNQIMYIQSELPIYNDQVLHLYKRNDDYYFRSAENSTHDHFQ